MSTDFNLLEERWIPVLWTDGSANRVGIREALTHAGRIRQIAASNPMDNVALLRFLLAVLVWCKHELIDDDRRLLESNTDGVPDQWLKKLDEHKAVFNLLGDGERFYQDKDAPSNGRPIGDLLVEFPTETKIAHFRHVRDKKYGLCPACCALGIVRFGTFANYAGKGYTTGINGPAPAYAIVEGATLLETLQLNWPASVRSRRQPPWLCATAPSVADLDAVTVFAWRSRRFWLNEPGDEGDCASCGERARLIRDFRNTGDWKPPFETRGIAKRYWDEDPHLILVEKRSTDEKDASDSEDDVPPQSGSGSAALTTTTLGFPRPRHRVKAHVGFWRRAAGSLRANRHAAKHVVVAGAATTQTGMLYQDAIALHLPCSTASAAGAIALIRAVEGLSRILRQSTLNPQLQHPERNAALDALSPSLETRLRHDLNDYQQPQDLKEPLRPVVQAVVSSTTPGSPLRRREAMKRAMSALDQALQKITSKREKDSSADENP